MKDFESVFFVSGSSRGLGKALAEALLADSGKNLVVGLSRSNSLQHERFIHRATDLSQDVEKAAAELFSQYKPGKKAVLVNNAGTLGPTTTFGKMDNRQIQQAFQVNVTAPAVLMNEFIKAYGGRPAELMILNISSGAGKYPVDGWGTYCASKAALDMLSEVAALEAQNKGAKLKVFSVAPGVVDTEMQGEIRRTSQEDFSRVQHFKQMKEEGALADPAAVAAKLMHLINRPEQFEEVQQDVRKF